MMGFSTSHTPSDVKNVAQNPAVISGSDTKLMQLSDSCFNFVSLIKLNRVYHFD